MQEDVILPANGWRPRPYQGNAWRYLMAGGKRCVLVWHRRSGKDCLAMHATAIAAMERVGNYWHMTPQQSQCRKAIWEAVNPHTGVRRVDEAFPPSIRASTRDTDMSIKFLNGSTWQALGSDTAAQSLVGSTPIGVVFSEYSLGDPRGWEYIRPILRENAGWAIFAYTPRPSAGAHGQALFDQALGNPGWFCERLTVDDTGFTEFAEAERNDGMPEALLRTEYYCDFDAHTDEDEMLIPPAWVDAAMNRWDRNAQLGPMLTMGVDVARGGADEMILAPMRGDQICEMIAIPSHLTVDGALAAGEVVKHVRDGAEIRVDVVGPGASVYDHMARMGVKVTAFNGSGASNWLDRSRRLKAANKRTEGYWRLREALDPAFDPKLALPPDPLLRADLLAQRWLEQGRAGALTTIGLWRKDDIKLILGRSPDRGDAVTMALMPMQPKPAKRQQPNYPMRGGDTAGWMVA